MTLTGILSYLAFINLTGFAVFGIDKYKAVGREVEFGGDLAQGARLIVSAHL